MGFRSIDEAIGHVEALRVNGEAGHVKTLGLDFSPILAPSVPLPGSDVKKRVEQDHGLADALDVELIAGRSLLLSVVSRLCCLLGCVMCIGLWGRFWVMR